MGKEPGGRQVIARTDRTGGGTSRARILAPGRAQLTGAELDARVAEIAAHLAAHGVQRADRIAVLLPNGPEMAVTFLGTIAAAACAPLNPGAPPPELERLLTDLGVAGLVVDPVRHAQAASLATRLGIPVVELVPADGPAGAFELGWSGASRPAVSAEAAPAPSDVALLLHTSGTTSRPKLVPLSHANLHASAANVASTLQLGPDDRCLNLMPLFHIHGLVAALLASVHAGAGVICTPGFSAGEVLDWIAELEPTWYTAVPTIHQAMLDVAARHRATGSPAPWRFRFVRSSSAALPVRVMTELEEVFGAPVLEAYGMTEAAHQMASNPLPPAVRKPGTVGPAAGPEIAVLGSGNRFLDPGGEGEIVIRGPNVMAGYLENPAANDDAFVDGWFRTGDLGRLDGDGYLTISGRLKEIINRGGENITPREVDDALLEHPDVAQAVAFSVPHVRLGEDVAAAVVLRPGAHVSTGELRQFVAARLADAKVPRRIVVVDEIPKGPSGKLQRTGLAVTLGLDGGGTHAGPYVAPRDDVEKRLARIVHDILRLDDPVGVTDDFFDLGADSLHTVELFEAIEAEFGRPFNAHILLEGATVERMADAIRNPADDPFASVVAIQPDGTRPPLFLVTRAGAVISARQLAPALGPDQPLFGLWVPAMHGPPEAAGSIEDIARECLGPMREIQPSGPYFVFGHSMGGLVAYDMARQLVESGETVGLIVLADVVHPSIVPVASSRRNSREQLARVRRLFTREGLKRAARYLRRDGTGVRVAYVPGTDQPFDHAAADARERAYRARPAVAPVVLLTTRHFATDFRSDVLGWESVITDDWTVIEVPGSHDSMLGEPYVHVLARHVADQLQRAQLASPRLEPG